MLPGSWATGLVPILLLRVDVFWSSPLGSGYVPDLTRLVPYRCPRCGSQTATYGRVAPTCPNCEVPMVRADRDVSLDAPMTKEVQGNQRLYDDIIQFTDAPVDLPSRPWEWTTRREHLGKSGRVSGPTENQDVG